VEGDTKNREKHTLLNEDALKKDISKKDTGKNRNLQKTCKKK